jgi:hypothetical protein
MSTTKISFIQFFCEKLAEIFRQLALISILLVVIDVSFRLNDNGVPGEFSITKTLLFSFISYTLSVFFKLLELKIKKAPRKNK